jgi:hypothetical protein
MFISDPDFYLSRISDPGSKTATKGSKRLRIQDPDQQHSIGNSSFRSTADSEYTERRKKVG